MIASETSPDIALVGGGLTTYMMAAILVHSGYDFIWFSGPETDQNRAGDTRTTTLHHAGKTMLDTLNIWPDLHKDAWPLNEIFVRIAQQNRPRQPNRWPLHFASESHPMGYVVHNQSLTEALWPKAQIATRYNRRITNFQSGSPCQLQDDTGKIWHCDLVIACDGPASHIRQQAGLKARQQARGQTAIVTTAETGRPIGTTAWQIFCQEGPLALMATDTHHASIVWTVSDARAAELTQADEQTFNNALNAEFGDHLGHLKVASERLLWPLRPVFVPKISAEGLVLAGDAAHALHPLAGMGYNLALSDAAILLDLLQQTKLRGLSAGHISLTTAYQRRRNVEILALMSATQTLDRLLSRQSDLITALSAIGMSVLGRSALRHQISKLAMGGSLAPSPLFSGKLHR